MHCHISHLPFPHFLVEVQLSLLRYLITISPQRLSATESEIRNTVIYNNNKCNVLRVFLPSRTTFETLRIAAMVSSIFHRCIKQQLLHEPRNANNSNSSTNNGRSYRNPNDRLSCSRRDTNSLVRGKCE